MKIRICNQCFFAALSLLFNQHYFLHIFFNFKFITTLVVGSYGFGIGGGFMSYGSRGFFPRSPQRNMVSGSKNYILFVNV
jgi:hypothetical protein